MSFTKFKVLLLSILISILSSCAINVIDETSSDGINSINTSVIPSSSLSESSSSETSTSEQSSSSSASSGVNVYTPYYSSVNGLTGIALKTQLHNIIDDHIEYSYADLWTLLGETDEDPNNPNNVILLYSGISRSKTQHGGNVGDWNREHTWPQSKGDLGTTMGPGTDLHHLRPEDVQVNSSRGNDDFGIVDNIPAYLINNTTDCYSNGSVFEPRDEVKGDIARMLFYMAVRYEGDLSDEPNLELNESTTNGSVPFMGKLSVLLEWHFADLPDSFEMKRNEVIYSHQKNRNPFIDYPEFATQIWGN
jgi:endonuclease I